jgi:serine beta-lactamase-like protein LACTB, mitochondrial
MFKIRMQTLAGLFVLALIGLIAAIAGLYVYVRATTTPLHPDPQNVPSVTSSGPPAQWAGAVQQAREIARVGLLDQNLPGLSVAVGVGGGIVWAEGFGWADLENQRRVTPDTRFRIGTASTILTSAAVGMLLEKGRLKLDEDIRTYVPGFPKKPWPVTLRQLMGHLAGLVPDEGDEEDVFTHCERTLDGLPRFADRPLLFEPGTQYRYSSYGWILVSAAVETVSSEPFFTFMRNQIFGPLGMDNTKADAPADTSPGSATTYFPRFGANTRYGPQTPDPLDYSCFAGSSAFLSTPSDLVRFGMAIGSGRLLEPATVQLLQAPQRTTSGQDTGYALGWDLEAVDLAGAERRLIVHDGDLRGGMVASFITFPERGIVVSVMSNTSFADTASIALKIADVFARQGGSRSRRMPDGKQWMTENLKVAVEPSYCYEGAEENCGRYGHLYTWESAQRACRVLGDGWRLPTNDEWAQLAKFYGGVRDDSADGGKAAYMAFIAGGASGFDVVYGGGRDMNGAYARLDAHGFYWTASESSPTTAWFYNAGKNGQILNRHRDGEKQQAFAVRCVRE